MSGAQPKLLLRKAGDTYRAESTDAEVYERYIVCEDLAQQLVTYTARKMAENTWSLQTAISKVEEGLLMKTRSGIWEFSDAEIAWTIGRTREILSDPASGRTSLAPDSNILNQAGEEKRDE
ncbi:hypothetical protein SCB29_22375 [Paraburkholderia sp. SIMBA_055]